MGVEGRPVEDIFEIFVAAPCSSAVGQGAARAEHRGDTGRSGELVGGPKAAEIPRLGQKLGGEHHTHPWQGHDDGPFRVFRYQSLKTGIQGGEPLSLALSISAARSPWPELP